MARTRQEVVSEINHLDKVIQKKFYVRAVDYSAGKVDVHILVNELDVSVIKEELRQMWDEKYLATHQRKIAELEKELLEILKK